MGGMNYERCYDVAFRVLQWRGERCRDVYHMMGHGDAPWVDSSTAWKRGYHRV